MARKPNLVLDINKLLGEVRTKPLNSSFVFFAYQIIFNCELPKKLRKSINGII